MNTVIQITDTNKGLGAATVGTAILIIVFTIYVASLFTELNDSVVFYIIAIIASLIGLGMFFIGLAVNDYSRIKNIQKAIETEYLDAVIIDKVDYTGSFASDGITYYYEVDGDNLKISAGN